MSLAQPAMEARKGTALELDLFNCKKLKYPASVWNVYQLCSTDVSPAKMNVTWAS